VRRGAGVTITSPAVGCFWSARCEVFAPATRRLVRAGSGGVEQTWLGEVEATDEREVIEKGR
jgi:hypothetical protein